MKSIWKRVIAVSGGLVVGGLAEKGLSMLLNRSGKDSEDDILDSGYEPKIGDGLDEDLREDPPED